ncbi:unnamed protein product [Gongylonema pulchrum]|uniref:Uncharacterized protein n=1 Tax=Gongylonema pulchrum TaxID=637853 RepID=A0A3P7P1A6_9BILA|nr:unnamed protein product [Gongylonema pulchrum]
MANAERAVYKEAAVHFQRQIENLEQRGRETSHILETQTARLLKLEDELAALGSEKAALQRKCTELERANDLAVQEKLEQLGVIETLRKELSSMEECLNEAEKKHNNEIEAYHKLVEQKENERTALIAEICALSRAKGPLRDSFAEIQHRHG